MFQLAYTLVVVQIFCQPLEYYYVSTCVHITFKGAKSQFPGSCILNIFSSVDLLFLKNAKILLRKKIKQLYYIKKLAGPLIFCFSNFM